MASEYITQDGQYGNKHNIEEPSRNHCYRWESISVTYSECAQGHYKRNRHSQCYVVSEPLEW